MEEVTGLRSIEQNALMWSRLGDIARQLQWPVNGAMAYLDSNDWKHIITAGLKREQRIAQGIDGGFVILGQYTHKMSKSEMADLITLIEAFGAQHDVQWTEIAPSPSPHSPSIAQRPANGADVGAGDGATHSNKEMK